MPELLLHYIWMRRLFLPFTQQTTDGRSIEVINIGKYNTDSGPDFFGATIKIGDMLWTGNVEMHIRSSDWFRHHHHTDKSYDNTILHVVCKADKLIYNSRGEAIVQCELRFADKEIHLRRFLTEKQEMCNTSLRNNPSLLSEHWRDVLFADRMERKTNDIRTLLALTHNSWEDSFYITLAHNFGFHTNGLPFEMLAKQTPIAVLRKHRNSLFQLEALLLGQAGLLKYVEDQQYQNRLTTEYDFLRKKFSLVPIDDSLWKRLRMRPQNFPHLRVRQFAQLIYQTEALFSTFVTTCDLKQIRKAFSLKLGDGRVGQQLGKSSVDLLIINSVVPYMYAYGKHIDDDSYVLQSCRILQDLPAENNHIISDWIDLGMSINNAADSQVFIHLTQNYCVANRCFDCEVGYNIFTKSVFDDK